jgi:hypothetical protein
MKNAQHRNLDFNLALFLAHSARNSWSWTGSIQVNATFLRLQISKRSSMRQKKMQSPKHLNLLPMWIPQWLKMEIKLTLNAYKIKYMS